jgi:2-polyprenyl-3-methyl-5-hydroxy-6-metoxy-1,4-benzoquinol methylase
MKGTIHQEEITVLNTHATNTGAYNYIQKTLMDLRAQIDPYTVIVGHMKTSLS